MSGTAAHLAATDPLVRDHRIGGTPVVPAAAQIDVVLTACDARRPDRVWTLENVTFTAPLRVTGPGVDLTVVTSGDGRCSLRSLDAGAGGAPVEHSTAHVRGAPLPPPRYLDPAGLRAGCAEPVVLADVAAWRQASGITYGPAYRAIRSAHRGPDRMLMVLRADTGPHGAGYVPPPLLDSVFQALGMLDGGVSGACLPWHVGRVVVRRRVSGTVLALVERDPAAGTRGGAVRGRATVCNQQGEVLIELDRITLKSPAAPAPSREAAEAERSVAGSIETVVWRKTGPAAAPAAREGALLLVAPRPVPAPDGRPVVHLAPDELTGERIDTALAATPVGTVVYAAPHGPAGADRVVEALQGVFDLVRRLAARPPMPDLVLVTSGAQQVVGEETVDPFMTSLWGLGRTMAVEHPRATVRLVDLEAGAVLTATALERVLGHAGPELAHRTDGWYRPEPGGHPPRPPVAAQVPRLRGGRFLITGGMGGIGLRVAEFLAAEGCAHLTLVGRNVPGAGDTRARLDRLGGLCRLDTVAADVRCLPRVLDGAERYDGVFHAAGVLRDALARNLTAHQVEEVLGPKIGGVHAIADLAADSGAPGFVALFSSVAAVRANPGQSAYAAANAYLDGYAARQRAAGQPWFSLGWGLWDVGMGAHIAPKAAAHGVPVLTADRGVALLRTVLGRPPGHYVLTAAANAKEEPMTAVTPERGLWLSLTTALRKILHVDDVAPQDDLLELGLDSMMAVELAASLSADGFETDPMAFFEQSTVGELARHLEPQASTGPAATAAPAMAPVEAPAAPDPDPVPVSMPAEREPEMPAPAAVAHTTADAFVPDWDRYRDPSPVAPETAGTTPPARTLRPPARTPRRTLPGRLAGRPDGTFLDRRIDALSAEDRAIVAKDAYFYEPVIEEARGAHIKFDGRWFLNFASYSYLGLIGHDYIEQQALRAVERHGTGAHGVRLLAGTLHLHRELELALARFLGTEDAVVFSSGYMANVATVGALVGPGDVIIGDVYNHASILDGYRLSGAEVVTYAHNDLADLERALKKAGDAGRLVVTDAVFSMDGDVADLPGIVGLCERYGAPLMVDEAHSLGVLGRTGRGITEHFGIDPARVDVKMGTLSKTVPSAGGYVAGPSDLVFALKNNARGWMFSAAVTPAQVAAAGAAIEVIEAAPHLPGELRARTTRYRERLRALGFDTLASTTPVVPVVCHSAEQAHAMARACQLDGLFVQPIVYPAVPRTLPRLRTIVSLSHSDADLDTAVATLEKAGRACGLIT
ncbi:aminotransferase [Streptomyces sp. WAC 06783]|uniref:bifunctional SDR family oxidoreductase/pyridoxal phosphate-dependent aminotransferase family protein n=1 Tax=Streptomyces sp. WAC 06783 TaxID=2203211 RepID=UPI000F742F40|nr:bifunctional SDR family oxidoreductase/pyridoxal phosphate-dependent aminotransferase family protein [Streptomyces sp. WAC 06783]RSO10948.1 aminotransferase [Streptomyces sp. WAC 06783]